jgi:alpha-soluble NSF attachment protein
MSQKHEEKAEAHLEKANKCITKLFKDWEGGEENFTKAANAFKMAQKHQEAGAAFMKAAECQIKLKAPFEAATHMVSAAGSFKRSSPRDAVDALQKACEIYTDSGKFHMAAQKTKEMAEILEDLGDVEQAIEAYRNAANYFTGEDSVAASNACLMKVGFQCALLEKYEPAIEAFEQVATVSIDNNLLKYSCKDAYLPAGLCHFCIGDMTAAGAAIERYGEQDVTFPTCREGKFLKELHAALVDENVETFTNIVFEYDSMGKLNPWQTTILLRIKEAMKSASRL